MKPPFLKTQYNHDRNEESDKTALVCRDPHLAEQSFQEECDINYIAKKFDLTGELPTPRDFNAMQGEFENFDLMTAMNQIRHAEETFMAYPAELRAKFDNDPRKFVEFFNDPDNTEKAVKLGLAKAPALDQTERTHDETRTTTPTPRTPENETPTRGTPSGQRKNEATEKP